MPPPVICPPLPLIFGLSKYLENFHKGFVKENFHTYMPPTDFWENLASGGGASDLNGSDQSDVLCAYFYSLLVRFLKVMYSLTGRCSGHMSTFYEKFSQKMDWPGIHFTWWNITLGRFIEVSLSYGNFHDFDILRNCRVSAYGTTGTAFFYQ